MLSGNPLGSVIPSLTSAVNKSGILRMDSVVTGDQPGADPDVDAVKSVVDLVR